MRRLSLPPHLQKHYTGCVHVLGCVRTTLHTCPPGLPFSHLKRAELQFLRSEETLQHDADVIAELGESQANSCICSPGPSSVPLTMGWGCLLLTKEEAAQSGHCQTVTSASGGHCGDKPGLTWGIRSFLCSCDGRSLGKIISFQLCSSLKICQVYATDRSRGKNAIASSS